MHKITIPMFTGKESVTIQALHVEGFAPMVTLQHFGGCMAFHLNMTTAQARNMATALIQHADEADNNQPETAK